VAGANTLIVFERQRRNTGILGPIQLMLKKVQDNKKRAVSFVRA